MNAHERPAVTQSQDLLATPGYIEQRPDIHEALLKLAEPTICERFVAAVELPKSENLIDRYFFNLFGFASEK